MSAQFTIVVPCESTLVPLQVPAKLAACDGADGDLAHEIGSAVSAAVETTRKTNFPSGRRLVIAQA